MKVRIFVKWFACGLLCTLSNVTHADDAKRNECHSNYPDYVVITRDAIHFALQWRYAMLLGVLLKPAHAYFSYEQEKMVSTFVQYLNFLH